MSLFSKQPAFCCVCGRKLLVLLTGKPAPLCPEKERGCYDEYNWRIGLSIMGREYEPDPKRPHPPIEQRTTRSCARQDTCQLINGHEGRCIDWIPDI